MNVLAEKDGKSENEPSVREQISELRKSYEMNYKALYGFLKEKNTTSVDYLGLSTKFDEYATSKLIEKASGVKREWFVRMSKGVKYLWYCAADMSTAKRRNDPSRFKKAEKNFASTRTRLIEVMKLRKKEYAVKK